MKSFKQFIKEQEEMFPGWRPLKGNANSKNVVEFLRRKHPDERGSGEHGPSTFSKPDDPSHLPNKLGIQQ